MLKENLQAPNDSHEVKAKLSLGIKAFGVIAVGGLAALGAHISANHFKQDARSSAHSAEVVYDGSLHRHMDMSNIALKPKELATISADLKTHDDDIRLNDFLNRVGVGFVVASALPLAGFAALELSGNGQIADQTE